MALGVGRDIAPGLDRGVASRSPQQLTSGDLTRMEPFLIIAAALVLIGLIAGGTIVLVSHDTMTTVSTFFSGPMGIGIAVAVVIVVAAAAWRQFGAKKPDGADSSTARSKEPKP